MTLPSLPLRKQPANTAECIFPAGRRTTPTVGGKRKLNYIINIECGIGSEQICGAFTKDGGCFKADRKFLQLAARVWPSYGKPDAECVFSGPIAAAQADIAAVAGKVAAGIIHPDQ